MKKILITGGAGSIGKSLVDSLIEKYQNPEILVIDNLSANNTELQKLKSVRFECLDIANVEKIRPLVQEFNPNYVFHLAAHFANQNSVDYPFSDIDTNITGTVNLLNACLGLAHLKKVVYASSSCVYGGDLSFMKVDSNIFPYETPYAINKYVGEMYMKYFNVHYKMPTVSVRIFNTYGPGEMAGKYRNVIPNFIEKALNNHDLTITGDGSEQRDFTYIEDTSQILLLASLYEGDTYEVFNGGSGIGLPIKQLAQKIIEIANSNSKLVLIPRRDWDHVHTRISDISYSLDLLNYVPKIGIDEGLIKTIEWYKKQKNKL
jgi:nucleoside-diphosphate-sugar epimerase